MTTIGVEPTTPHVDGIAPLAAALARFQAEMPTVPKTKTADTGTYRYSYADLAAITSAALPLLTAQGLSFATCPRYTEHGYELVGVLLHSSGESMEGALPIHGNSAQQLGSAITYARRYLFGCMTGVVTDDDDDGRLASQAKPARKKAAAPTAAQERPKQIQLMGALMRSLGLNSKDAALDYTMNVIGRPIASRDELTNPELAKVIDALQTRGVPASPIRGGEDHSTPSRPSPPPPTDDNDDERLVTRPQQKMMFAIFNRLGIGDDEPGRQERLRIMGLIVGHPLSTSSGMTIEEGQTVLDTLALAGGSLQQLHIILDSIDGTDLPLPIEEPPEDR